MRQMVNVGVLLVNYLTMFVDGTKEMVTFKYAFCVIVSKIIGVKVGR